MLEKLLSERILLLDGAMGTMIQRARLAEEDYRGARFRDWPRELRGNNDLLCLTQPALIQDIHAQYLDAGADIIETNTFNSTAIAMADYGMQEHVHELNLRGAQIIDVNMDEAMLDSQAAMVSFLNLIGSEPDISRVPVMIDSS